MFSAMTWKWMLRHPSTVFSQRLSSNFLFAVLASTNRDLIAWREPAGRDGCWCWPAAPLPVPGFLCLSLPALPASAAAAGAETMLSLPVQRNGAGVQSGAPLLWCPGLTARLKSGESFLSALGQKEASLKVFVVCLKQNVYFMCSSCRISQFGILWHCSINFHPLLPCRYFLI